MKILILGAGITGVTTAYFLAERGYDVEVVDREPASAMQTSFANGGQLSYSHAEPWANPSVLTKAMKWALRDDAPLLFRPKLNWHTLSWLGQFLRQCTSAKAAENTVTTLRLGLYSRQVLNDLAERTKVKFHYRHKGIVHIFKDAKAFGGALRQADFQVNFGAPYKKLSPEECVELEPALAHVTPQLHGAVYYPDDESGDIHLFTRELATKGEKTGKVKFHYSTTVKEILTQGTRITGVLTDRGEMNADMYVMCLGSCGYTHLKHIGITVPMYPMKGYSISVEVGNTRKNAPIVSITDQSEKLVYSRLGPVLRVAGTAEFAGFDFSVKPKRIQMLKDCTRRLFPECGDVETAKEWACLRPQMPDGAALLGMTPYSNLILNTGHGSLGWTLGPGSAKITADLIEGKVPDISLQGLTLSRYGYSV